LGKYEKGRKKTHSLEFGFGLNIGGLYFRIFILSLREVMIKTLHVHSSGDLFDVLVSFHRYISFV